MTIARTDPAQRADRSEYLSSRRDELRAALDTVFPRVVDVETRPSPYASSFAIEEATVRFDDGSSLELVCKDTGEAAMLPEAQRIRPRFLYDPHREIAAYERILAPLDLGAPRFFGSAIDERRGRYWMFLERVRGVPLTEVGDFGTWQQVSGWLASMHARVRRDPRLARAAAGVGLVQYDRAQSRVWMERAQWYLHSDETRPRPARLRFASLLVPYERILDEIAALPAGFVHGEFFASNVLVATVAGEVRVRPVDWEVAGMGPMLMDLAALTAGRWTEGERFDLAIGYRAAASEEGEPLQPLGAFMRGLDCCRLQLAVQRLGWARQWTPPATQSQDWLGEALHVADRLGL